MIPPSGMVDIERAAPKRLAVDDGEEKANAATHAAGFALSVLGSAVLLARAKQHGGRWQFWGCTIYAATMVAAYAASTLSHLFRDPRRRDFFRSADQALIFLFIAGSFTPVAFTWLRSPTWWWAFHGFLWGTALVGFVSKIAFSHRVTLGTFSALAYVVMAWSPLVVAVPLARACPTPLLLWLLAGGACYTAGIVFFFRHDHRVRFFHAAWHVLVIAGSACHFAGILGYCTRAVP